MRFLRRRAVLLRQLGLRNVLRVLVYRLGLRTCLHSVCRLKADIPNGPFFSSDIKPLRLNVALCDLPPWRIFGWHDIPLEGDPPDWLYSIQAHVRVPEPGRPWWEIPDFSDEIGDIKAIWELSRFDWVTLLAQRLQHGDLGAAVTLNAWLSDWLQTNPPYLGPNWKCGQEASIRVIHLAFAALLLEQIERPSKGIMDLVRLHLLRIRPTLSYALGQANNHAISEATALFIGGSWLYYVAGDRRAWRWATKGRRVLEERVRALFAPDGSFSQYSTNYHRLALSTLCAAETWRRHLKLPLMSERFYKRADAATRWLVCFVNPINGEPPNIGANDGARLLPLSDADHRDFRPDLEWASNLFCSARVFPADKKHDVLARMFGIAKPDGRLDACGSAQFDDGGYAVMRSDGVSCYLNYPRYRFRPRHSDALHIDLWCDGVNWLRDGGSYSYNSDAAWDDYFPSTAAHNTVEFDGRDQMPRAGRFLRAEWLQVDDLEPVRTLGETVKVAAAYRDWLGARHHRAVSLSPGALHVRDQVDGFAKTAVLRWRLRPGKWRISGYGVEGEGSMLHVKADVPIVRCELVMGWESRYYMCKTPLPVLEIEIREPGVLLTEFSFQ
ncbi:heparinase II/III family protein [Thiohalophilus thiocyanatoxydans]|uniref:Heparinase II/III-like protein n=1 Tax=Thiohalophilus thiocyanatoxydans TaxID=381308 RepID=A0A4R8IP55_9GAMM|nr:heparinase II/III-family protein [Thiohalophilus thiocyanatoxydans]TDY02691.1 heparinase II/III-like protein [Thiohalophilus thiocyanatoxydans]